MESLINLQGCASYNLDVAARKQLSTVKKTIRERSTFAHINKQVTMESISVPDNVLAAADLSDEIKKLILINIANNYYEDMLLHRFIQINDYLINIADRLPENKYVGLIDSPIAATGLHNLVKAYAEDDIDTIKKEVTVIETCRPFYVQYVNIRDFFNENLVAIRNYQDKILPYITKNKTVIETLNEDLDKDDCLACQVNKIILSFYRSFLKTIISLGNWDIDSDIIDAVKELDQSTKPFTHKQLAILVNGFMEEEKVSAVTLAMEGIDVGKYAKQLYDSVKKMFAYMRDKIVQFFKFIVSLFRKSKDVNKEIDEQISKMTPEEKEKAKEAGKPKFYGDKASGKVYAFDAKDNYLVTMTTNPFKPVVREEPKKVEEVVKENPPTINVMPNGIASLEDIITNTYTKADTLEKVTYALIMDGKDAGKIFIDILKATTGYITSDFNTEAKNAIADQSRSGLEFNDTKFPKLVELLKHINETMGYPTKMGNNVADYVKNTMDAGNESDEEITKLSDDFVKKLATIKIDSSYEELTRIISDVKPKLNESMFGHPENMEAQVYFNRILTVYKRLISIYRHYATRGVEYYQLVYIPIAAAHNIGEIGEKAAMLYAGKKQSPKNEEKD